MYRPQRPDDPRLESLLDDRDHLKIKLSLALDSSLTDEEQIRELRKALSDAESRIRLHYPSP